MERPKRSLDLLALLLVAAVSVGLVWLATVAGLVVRIFNWVAGL